MQNNPFTSCESKRGYFPPVPRDEWTPLECSIWPCGQTLVFTALRWRACIGVRAQRRFSQLNGVWNISSNLCYNSFLTGFLKTTTYKCKRYIMRRSESWEINMCQELWNFCQKYHFPWLKHSLPVFSILFVFCNERFKTCLYVSRSIPSFRLISRQFCHQLVIGTFWKVCKICSFMKKRFDGWEVKIRKCSTWFKPANIWLLWKVREDIARVESAGKHIIKIWRSWKAREKRSCAKGLESSPGSFSAKPQQATAIIKKHYN